jgi:hypothetical protein
VGDVGLAGAASLALMGQGAKASGFADAVDLVGRQVGRDLAQQLIESGSALRG